jgi:hypothetical protein
MKWLGEELIHATTQPNKDRTKRGQGIVVPPTVVLACKEWCGAIRQESLVDLKRLKRNPSGNSDVCATMQLIGRQMVG